ncbi:response regulator transcription factor [Rhodoferax sp.]|uniref:response regulator transcription factor n=1 Tax=Rhodoferax sp. TaxID=50421 RepID=UPI00262604CD|nr:response regulator transcription factor [Rhodoferax sp.]MDD2919603.1 response regulator transcription factor [Rhodoferax sp.]
MKILVVDDHVLVREGLCQVLQGIHPGEATEVLQAATCSRAFELAHFNPDLDLVLLDYRLPDMSGLTALEIFGQRHPELPVVILSGSANPSVIQQARDLGAAGFVTKSSLSDTMLTILRKILAGETYHPSNFSPLGEEIYGAHIKTSAPPVLSPRQQDVLGLLLSGLTNRQISEQLSMGAETVKFHVSNILRIFGTSTRTQAVLAAKRWGYDQLSSRSP